MSRLLEAIRRIEARKPDDAPVEPPIVRSGVEVQPAPTDTTCAVENARIQTTISPSAEPEIPRAQPEVFSQPWPAWTAYDAQPQQPTYRTSRTRIELAPTPEPRIDEIARRLLAIFPRPGTHIVGLVGFSNIDTQWDLVSQLAAIMTDERAETVVALDTTTLRENLSTVADLRRRKESFIINCGLVNEPSTEVYAAACDTVVLLIMLNATSRKEAAAAVKQLKKHGATDVRCVAIEAAKG